MFKKTVTFATQGAIGFQLYQRDSLQQGNSTSQSEYVYERLSDAIAVLDLCESGLTFSLVMDGIWFALLYRLSALMGP